MMREFLDVVHQTIQMPLRVYLGLGSQRKAVEPLVVPKVGEHRFHRSHSTAVDLSSSCAIDGLLHALCVTQWRILTLGEDRQLTHLGALRIAQTAVPQIAGHTVALGPREFVVRPAIDGAMIAV